jgi:hypothetical protein
MQTTKTHPLKLLTTALRGHSRILLLGPLEIEKHLIAKSIKSKRATLILFIDGGLRHQNSLTKKVLSTFSLGDNDSNATAKSLDLLLPAEKNYSDLAYALKVLGKTTTILKSVSLLGFSSKKNDERPDHLLFTLKMLEKFVKKRPICVNLDDHFLFFPPGKNSFSHKGLFSVISFCNQKIKLTGKAKYKLNDMSPLTPMSSLGLSNCAHGTVYLESSKALIIYLV